MKRAEILKVISTAAKTRDDVLLIREVCCGKVHIVRREVLTVRFRKGIESCRKCRGADEDLQIGANRRGILYGVNLPEWPVPQTVFHNE